MAAFSRRTFLARNNGLSAVERIYRTRDAIEVDELEGYDVSRRRVLDLRRRSCGPGEVKNGP